MGSRRGLRQRGAEPRQVSPAGNQGGTAGMARSLSLVLLATYASTTQLWAPQAQAHSMWCQLRGQTCWRHTDHITTAPTITQAASSQTLAEHSKSRKLCLSGSEVTGRSLPVLLCVPKQVTLSFTLSI